MVMFIAGLVLFFGAHLFSAFRSRVAAGDLREQIGYGPYMGLYSLVAIAGLVLIVMGYGAMRPSVVLYQPPAWGAHLNYLLMLAALIILASAYLPTGYIARTLKHPMLVAIKIWALGHLLANGELNSVILFAAFLAYGVIDRIAVKRRGDAGAGAVARPSLAGDGAAVIVGTGAYIAILLLLHPALFGVAVWPPTA